jgi:hypothetical protein
MQTVIILLLEFLLQILPRFIDDTQDGKAIKERLNKSFDSYENKVTTKLMKAEIKKKIAPRR